MASGERIHSEPVDPSRACLACGRAAAKNRCGGCRCVYFCDRACQIRMWPTHRADCHSKITAVPAEKNTLPSKTTDDSMRIRKEDAEVQSATVVKSSPKTVTLAEPIVTETMEFTSTSSPVKNSKKKKHKKKKGKQRSNSLHAPQSAPMTSAINPLKGRSASLSVRKHVMWGDVSAREFARFPGGGGAVPYDGTWALGLGDAVGDIELGSVLQVQEWKEEELKQRAKELTKAQRSLIREGETRQFDYRRGVDNPLFARLSEKQRKRVFEQEKEQQQQQHDSAKGSSSSSSSPKQHPKHSPLMKHMTRSRKMSLCSLDSNCDTDPVATTDFACISIEQLDEFAKIRDSREGACGCSCGDLVKKVSKMNVKKLHAFLAERGVHVTVHMKPELMAMAKSVASQEKNCTNQKDCECLRNGVPCHANACEGCSDDCWNPHHSYTYKKDEVRQYRKLQLAKWQADLKQQSISVV